MFSFAINNHNEVNNGSKDKKSDQGKEQKRHHSPKKKPSPKRKLKYQSESEADTEELSEEENEAGSEAESSDEREETPKRRPKPQVKPASAEKKPEPKAAENHSAMDTTAESKKGNAVKPASAQQSEPAVSASAAQQTAPVFGGGNTFFSNPFPVATAPLERPVGNRRFFRDFQEGLIDGCPARQETIRCVTRETFQGYVTVSVQEKTTLQIRNPHTGFLLFNRTTVNEHSETEQQEAQAVGNYFNPFGGTY